MYIKGRMQCSVLLIRPLFPNILLHYVCHLRLTCQCMGVGTGVFLFCQVKFSVVNMNSYKRKGHIKCAYLAKFSGSLRSPIKITNNVQIKILSLQ